MHACRFGAQFKVPMPDMNARKEILRLILTNHDCEMPYAVDQALLQVCTVVLDRLCFAMTCPIHCSNFFGSLRHVGARTTPKLPEQLLTGLA